MNKIELEIKKYMQGKEDVIARDMFASISKECDVSYDSVRTASLLLEACGYITRNKKQLGPKEQLRLKWNDTPVEVEDDWKRTIKVVKAETGQVKVKPSKWWGPFPQVCV